MDAKVQQFLQKLTTFPTSSGVKFVSFTYRSKGTGELAKYLVNIGVSFTKLYEKDVETMKAMIPTLTGDHLSVATEILSSLQESLDLGLGNNSRYVHSAENADTYTTLEGFPGVKVHNETGEVNVMGVLVHKKVLEPGTYKEVKSRPRTLIKKELEKGLRKSTIRQFTIPMDDREMLVKVDGETLELN